MLINFLTPDTGLPAGNSTPPESAHTDAPPETSADDKKFTQADLDAVLKERLARQQRQFEAQQREAQQALEAKQLEEQAEWQKLANRRAEELRDLKPRAQLAESYEKAVKQLLEVQTRELPVSIQTLLEKLSLVDQLDWLAANGAAVKPQTNGRTDTNAFARNAPGASQTLTDEEYRKKKRSENIYT